MGPMNDKASIRGEARHILVQLPKDVKLLRIEPGVAAHDGWRR